MAKIKYDVKGVEGGTDYGTPIPVGLYLAKVAEVEETVSNRTKKPMLKVTIEIAAGDSKGRKLWDYIVLDDASAWKLKQFIDALGLKDSGTFDTKKVAGTVIQVRVKHESSDEYGTSAKVGALLPAPDDSDEDFGDDDDDDLEAAMTEGDGGDDTEVEDDAEAEDEDGDDLTLEDLEDYDREDLEAVIEENELEGEVKFNKRTPDDKLRERIAEALGLEADEDEADEADEDEGEEDEAPDYDEWELADLRTELKSRGLKSSGPKKVLVKRLKADDETDDDDAPF